MPVAVRPGNRHASQKNVAVARKPTAVGKQRSSSPLTVVETLSRPEPTWLPWVIRLRQGTSPLAITSVILVLILYAVNVIVQRDWSLKYQQVETTQHQNNDLLIKAEKRKYQIPHELEAAPKNFVDLNQTNTLFLTPDPVQQPQITKEIQRHSLLRDDRVPVGY